MKEAGLTDDEDIVRITAYVLQVNGAKPRNSGVDQRDRRRNQFGG